MKTIMVLEDSMINKIAAGEVVERPGSVVKELVENAIDAGATQITVEIKDGGIGLIRVSDNGSGIPKDQVLSAFMRHATSKIRDMNDLEYILTLGFRGEALSSIAAVSQMEMITKTVNDTMAHRVEIQGGKLITEQQIGAQNGTTIIMRNLFFNTPARRKFLKKPGTESSHISDIMNRIVLGHPEISFRYIVNHSEVLYTNGKGELKTVIFGVYGKDVAKKLIEVEYENDGLKVSGYIGKPETGRSNRSYGNLFINGRYIKSSIIENAIEEAYKTKLLVGKFPIYVLNLHMKPNFVDVNVHPQKLEVRFSDEDKIYQLFMNAIQKALQSENLIPEYTAKEEKPFVSNIYQIEKTPKINYRYDKDANKLDTTLNSNGYSVDMGNILGALFSNGQPDTISTVSEAKPAYYHNESAEKSVEPAGFFSDYRIIGQFFSTYWLVEQDNIIYLIDQHAAHERCIFEDLMTGYKTATVISQQLVAPVIYKLSDMENEAIQDNTALLESFGFDIESMGDNELALKGLPFMLRGAVNFGFFTEILDHLTSKNHPVENVYEQKLDSIASISCKAAVKGNDRLSFQEAKGLIEKLLTLENPFTCPHGRPTIVKLTKYEVEKMFKRIQ